EIKALLLATSLRKHWPATVELIACVPQDPQFGELSTNAARILDSLDIRVTSVVNPIGADYPIANKLLCLDVETEADRILFLDSDILAMTDVTEQDLVAVFGDGFVAKPADLATFNATVATWASIYEACGAVMPNLTVTATVSGETMVPYFNAGVIAVKANSGFGRLWADCAAVVDALADVPRKRPHLDQIALPIAASKSGGKIDFLTEEWNFPANLRPLPSRLPKLCHYHWTEVIEREPALLDAVEEFTAGNPDLAAILGSDEKWRGVLRKIQPRRRTPRPKRLPVGVITGIPRSGTSYLCRLLHELPGHVVINEPSEIFAPLKKTAPGHRLACYYRDLRRRILDGEPVENKTDDSGIIADTAKGDVRTKASIAVQNDDFMLWTKNTLTYLSRLPQLLDAMPEATFVACVRHPVDTIASWARTFPHLRDAAVERFPVGSPSDPLLSPAQREQLAVIAACTDLPRRRALLWNYLANIILEYKDRLIIVRLEDLAAQPERVCPLVTQPSPAARAMPRPEIAPKIELSAGDAQACISECTVTAAAFDYTMAGAEV
ncbi:MAG: sulfotransferase, partial [Sphaerospermopsis kisseleviana]